MPPTPRRVTKLPSDRDTRKVRIAEEPEPEQRVRGAQRVAP